MTNHDTIIRTLEIIGTGTPEEIAAQSGIPRSKVQRILPKLPDVERTGEKRAQSTGRPAQVWRIFDPSRPTVQQPVRKIHKAVHATLMLGADGQPVSPQHNREEWKKVRGPLIGSSDLAALLGRDQYQGPWQVWDRILLGKWDEQPGEPSGDIRRGNRQEQNALKRFTEMYGLETDPVGMIRHREVDLIVSDLDAVVLRPAQWPQEIIDNTLWDHVRENCKGPGAVEVKVPRTAKFFEYRDEGMLTGHAIQMQHHMEVADLEWGIMVFYNPEYDTCYAFPVVREKRIGKWMREQIPVWYTKHIDGRVRPMKPMPDPPVWPARIKGEATVRNDGEWFEQADLVARRWYELVEAQRAYEQTEANLVALLGDGDESNHVVGNGVVVKRTQSASQRRFNAGAFVAAVELAQKEGDADALLALDATEDRFYFKTEPKKKIDVKVVGPNPAEMIQ